MKTTQLSVVKASNVQDWYGDRHTCQIASGALDPEYTWKPPILLIVECCH